MATKARSVPTSPVDAVQAVYAALEPLDDATRQKVLASVTALLGMAPPLTGPGRTVGAAPDDAKVPAAPKVSSGDRPKSVVELIQEKQPRNNAQKIALFAYYRERVEGVSRFAKSDLKTYFAAAKEKPAANYDRDFSQAVRLGWIHEDGSDSYLTSRGLEAVESGFTGAQGVPRKSSPKRSNAKNSRKTRR